MYLWKDSMKMMYSKCFKNSKMLTKIKVSVQFNCLVVSDSLWPHELQHTRPPCPSSTPESTQIHVHRVNDAIQPSHPLSSPSPPAFNLSQHQALFQWVSSSHQVAKVLEFQLQHQSLQHPGLISKIKLQITDFFSFIFISWRLITLHR